MKNTSDVVNHIQNFTSQKDQELICFSLMQSIGDLFKPSYQSIIRSSNNGQITGQFVYQDGEGVYLETQLNIPPPAREIIDELELSGRQEASTHYKHEHLTIALINQSQFDCQYFVLQTRQALSESERHLLSGLCSIYKNYNTLIDDAKTDQLTGLLNRKTFETAITKFWKASKTSKYEGQERRSSASEQYNWIVIIDIDHFKQINDKFGHVFGDEVLIIIGNLLKTSFRSGDMVFRFGGEEFVVLIKSASEDQCHQLLHRLRKKISQTNFPNIDHLTVSMGACEFRGDIFYVSLLDYADRALYQSKDSGRDAITFFNIDEELAGKEEQFVGGVDLF